MNNTTSPLWHPCTQMKDHESLAPLKVATANGIKLQLEDGREIFDVTSSWWCKNLGHGHPQLRAALKQQADQLEHCMLANATHQPVEQLSQALTKLLPSLTHINYAGDGACAVEMAMKMSVHARQILGQTHKIKFATLQGAYHGETLGALSVSDIDSFSKPYKSILMPCHVIESLPYVHSKEEALWNDATLYWERIKQQLDPIAHELTAILVEPILQAVNSMKLYSADILKRLRAWCNENDVHLIADEIMTGFGRTGKMFACEHADIEPDFLCLGKSMTGGWLPMSAVISTDAIYDLFYDEYETGKTFIHSHTYAGNPLAASVAVANLKVIQQERLVARAAHYEQKLIDAMTEIADITGAITNIRGIGMVVAADLVNSRNVQRYGYEIYKRGLQHGLLMRPLGNTIYWVLPINIEECAIRTITQAVIAVLS
jgi:adenosylmethionine-8-amino-7-oxononanoate aminotransferase